MWRLEFTDFAATDETAWLGAATILFGLAGYVIGFHARIWPFARYFERQVASLRREIVSITGVQHLDDEDGGGRSVYRVWIDAICDDRIRTFVHYESAWYYTLATLAAYLAATELWFALALGTQVWIFFVGPHREPILVQWLLWRTPDVVWPAVAAWLCARSGMHRFTRANEDARMAMHIEESAKQLKSLAYASLAAGKGDVSEEQSAVVKQAFGLVAPTLLEKIHKITRFKVVEQYDLRTDLRRRVVHVGVRMSDIESAQQANDGDKQVQNLYNGPTQQRLQAHVLEALGPKLGVVGARLQILPPGRLDEYHWPEPTNKTGNRLPVHTALEQGVIPRDGVLHRMCIELRIDEVLFRNGYYVGPSPGLRHAIEHVLSKLSKSAKVYDPFGGTFLTSVLCRRRSAQTQCLCLDLHPGDRRESLKRDAFSGPPDKQFDLVVLDPMYEDCYVYLTRFLSKLKTRFLVIQCGDTQDLSWNDGVEKLLDSWGEADDTVPSAAREYGTHVLVYRARSPT